MFGLKLSLPSYVSIDLSPNPEDEGATSLLVISARGTKGGKSFEVRKTIHRDIGAVQFGKDLMAAINYLYQQIQKG